MKIETLAVHGGYTPDPRDPAAFAPLIDARTKAVFCESVGNPLGNVTDIAALTSWCIR